MSLVLKRKLGAFFRECQAVKPFFGWRLNMFFFFMGCFWERGGNVNNRIQTELFSSGDFWWIPMSPREVFFCQLVKPFRNTKRESRPRKKSKMDHKKWLFYLRADYISFSKGIFSASMLFWPVCVGLGTCLFVGCTFFEVRFKFLFADGSSFVLHQLAEIHVFLPYLSRSFLLYSSTKQGCSRLLVSETIP